MKNDLNVEFNKESVNMEWDALITFLRDCGREIMPRFHEKFFPDSDYSNEDELRDMAYACWNGSYLMRDLLREPWSLDDEDDGYFDILFTENSIIEPNYIYHFLDKSIEGGDVHYFTIIRTLSKTYHIATYGGIPRIDAREVTGEVTDMLRSIAKGDSLMAIKFFDIPEWDLDSVKYPSILHYHRYPIRPISFTYFF